MEKVVTMLLTLFFYSTHFVAIRIKITLFFNCVILYRLFISFTANHANSSITGMPKGQ